jgi:hypothetical protein
MVHRIERCAAVGCIDLADASSDSFLLYSILP